jgi:hypothetical protein
MAKTLKEYAQAVNLDDSTLTNDSIDFAVGEEIYYVLWLLKENRVNFTETEDKIIIDYNDDTITINLNAECGYYRDGLFRLLRGFINQ